MNPSSSRDTPLDQDSPLTQNHDLTDLTDMMRARTAESHRISDLAINLRLASAIRDRQKWGQSLAAFYVIIARVENLIERHKGHEMVARYALLLPSVGCTAAFEADLSYYLGDGYREHLPRTPAIDSYLAHLDSLAERNPVLLLPFAYHLHMGILSGGVILAKTARREMQLPPSRGTAFCEGPVLDPPSPRWILKKKMKDAMNSLAFESELQREELLKQSVNCFLFNNRIVEELPFGARTVDVFRMLPLKLRACVLGAIVVTTAIAVKVAGNYLREGTVRSKK